MTSVMSGGGNSLSSIGKKPSLNISKGDDRFYYDGGGEDEGGMMMGNPDDVDDDENDSDEDEDGYDDGMDADCPLCLEEMDEGDQLFKPCPCGYQVSKLFFENVDVYLV